jgi:hypothetical protein
MRDSEAGQPLTAFTDEDRSSLFGSQASLAAERAKGLCEIGGEGHAPLLATFAAEEDLVGRLQP